jgi:hypothetical protein
MSVNGTNMLLAIRQVRQSMTEIQSLLLEADAMMAKAGWVPKTNIALARNSLSINWPNSWIPYTAFRFYRHAQASVRIGGISVLLESPPEAKVQIDEPMIASFSLDFEAQNQLPEGVTLYDAASWPLHGSQKALTGSTESLDTDKLAQQGSQPKAMSYFIIPLASIQNRKHLEASVISRLQSLLAAGGFDPGDEQ